MDGEDRRQRERVARRGVQDPAGDEGFSRGGWVGLLAAREEIAKVALDEALGAEALLLGRRTYEFFAGPWPSRSGELADRLNSLPKHIVSSSLEDPDWNNSTVLKGDAAHEVSQLRHELHGEIVVPGSFQLLRTLIEHDLVDELRLKVFPVVLGAGERLFGETTSTKPVASSTPGPSVTASPSSPASLSAARRGVRQPLGAHQATRSAIPG